MAWFSEKSSTRYERLAQEKRRIEIQLEGLDLLRRETEKLGHNAEKHVEEWLSSGLRAPH
jgi:hypothetical protein